MNSQVAQFMPRLEDGFDSPRIDDAAAIHELIRICTPLDLNSTYAYLLLCHHFSDTCILMRERDRIVGFVSAYRPPADAGTLFVWQVAVHPDARGQGLGVDMLRHLLSRPNCRDIRHLESTVSPSNYASDRMFRRLAEIFDAQCHQHALFDQASFGGENHEEEILYRVGPFRA